MALGNLPNCLPPIFREEGGLSLDRNDKGNWTGGAVGKGELRGTRYGIAASSHPRLDIKNLSRDRAGSIYEHEYWSPTGCESLAAGVDLSIFDISVNAGTGRARQTRDATANINEPLSRIKAIAGQRRAFYQRLSTFGRYGKVWLGRVSRIEADATKMNLKASSKSDAEIKDHLDKEAKTSADSSANAKKGAVVTGTGTAGTGTAAGPNLPVEAPKPKIDPATIDHTIQAAHSNVWVFVAIGVVVLIGIGVTLYLIHRSRAHSERAKAFAAAAAQ